MHNEATLEDIQSFHGQYPRQIWYLFFSEMWERFCFYGMRGMLTVFMISELFFNEKDANLQYGATQAFVYAFTFIGGLFADKILGFRKSLFWGGLLMIAGSLILAVDPKTYFFLGIAFIILGTGFFKPNISTMVGLLYKPGDPRRDAGFSLFYAGINIGALLGGYLCVAIGKQQMLTSIIPADKAWNVAFGLTAIVMTISLLTFVFTKNHIGPIGLSPLKEKVNSKVGRYYEMAVYIGSIFLIPIVMTMVSKTQYTDLFMAIIGPATLIYLVYEMMKVDVADRKKLIAALVFIVFSILFWAIYEQAGGSLAIFANYNVGDKLMGIKLDPNGVNNSANSFFVIILSFVIGSIWLWMNKRKIEPNTVIKFGLGFLFLAGAYFIFYATRFFADANGVTSLNVFTTAYLVITLGELCLSPIGLSIMTKLSPYKLQGVMMGMWFLASAYGQYVAGILGAGMSTPSNDSSNIDRLMSYTNGYGQLAIYALIAGVILIVISPWVRKMMQEVK
jgi:POT family proton-dependent oligopeptide transporter